MELAGRPWDRVVRRPKDTQTSQGTEGIRPVSFCLRGSGNSALVGLACPSSSVTEGVHDRRGPLQRDRYSGRPSVKLRKPRCLAGALAGSS